MELGLYILYGTHTSKVENGSVLLWRADKPSQMLIHLQPASLVVTLSGVCWH